MSSRTVLVIKYLTFLLCAFSVIHSSAQTENKIEVDTLKPQIILWDLNEKNKSFEEHNKIKPNVHSVNAFDENKVEFEKQYKRPIHLMVKGRGVLNHVMIYKNTDESAEEYPLIDQEFRHTEFEKIDLSELDPGEYLVEVISPGNTTTMLLLIKEAKP